MRPARGGGDPINIWLGIGRRGLIVLLWFDKKPHGVGEVKGRREMAMDAIEAGLRGGVVKIVRCCGIAQHRIAFTIRRGRRGLARLLLIVEVRAQWLHRVWGRD